MWIKLTSKQSSYSWLDPFWWNSDAFEVYFNTGNAGIRSSNTPSHVTVGSLIEAVWISVSSSVEWQGSMKQGLRPLPAETFFEIYNSSFVNVIVHTTKKWGSIGELLLIRVDLCFKQVTQEDFYRNQQNMLAPNRVNSSIFTWGLLRDPV